MTQAPIALIGDGIENPWNARTLLDAAAMFGGDCHFRDRSGLVTAWRQTIGDDACLPLLSREDLARDYAPIIALDNGAGATDVYGFRVARGPRPAVAVGNERRGISSDVQALAAQRMQIPLASARLNTLNVASAAAVALYYLARGGGGAMQTAAAPNRRRPELLLCGPGDHVELGSAIRSAGAFGWERLVVEDRAAVWFGADRGRQTEGRAAARRSRNPIRIVPVPVEARFAFAEVCVVSIRRAGLPLHRVNLARGPGQLLVIPDESRVQTDHELWGRLGATVRFVNVELPAREFPYHFRLIASIALAEAARQVGRRAPRAPGRRRHRPPVYDRTLAMLSADEGETIFLDDLEAY